MKAHLLGLAIAATALLFCPKLDAMPSDNGDTRALLLTNVIDKDAAMQVEALRETAVASPTKKVVPVLIMSPGGSVAAMNHIINNMTLLKKAGFELECLAVEAQSAAFMIWLECTRKLVLPFSKLMFHYPFIRYPYGIGAEEAEEMYRQLKALQEKFRITLMQHMLLFMSPLEIEQSALTSRTYTGTELCSPRPGFCQIVTTVKPY